MIVNGSYRRHCGVLSGVWSQQALMLFVAFLAESSLAAGSVCPTASDSQAAKNTDLLTWLEQYVIVRKSFSATPKDATAPAAIAYESATPGTSNAAIDVAVKGKPREWNCEAGVLTLSPTVEWHKSTLESNQVNKLSVDATLLGGLYLSSANDYVGSGLKYKVARDFIQDNYPTSLVWRIFYYGGPHRGVPWPGAHWKTNDGEAYFYYLPFVGLDHYTKLPLKEQQFGQSVQVAGPVDGSFYAAGVQFFFNPFPGLLHEQLTLSGAVTWRERFSGDSAIPRSSSLTQLSLTYFFTRNRDVGFGFDYQNGRDPDRNFLPETRQSVGIKIQIGK